MHQDKITNLRSNIGYTLAWSRNSQSWLMTNHSLHLRCWWTWPKLQATQNCAIGQRTSPTWTHVQSWKEVHSLSRKLILSWRPLILTIHTTPALAGHQGLCCQEWEQPEMQWPCWVTVTCWGHSSPEMQEDKEIAVKYSDITQGCQKLAPGVGRMAHARCRIVFFFLMQE